LRSSITVIENLTKDGRDRSLDYKLSGISICQRVMGGKGCRCRGSADDELVIPKTSSSLFNSTNIDYLLRKSRCRGVGRLTGFLSDQCIDHTVKDAADRGYYPTLIRDACMANTRERHEAALTCFAGYMPHADDGAVSRHTSGNAPIRQRVERSPLTRTN
jgi:isochorismate hydrolase